ncbi:hypothetical protein [Antarcticibacterium sp. 1MA-6-2]|uniref:hypothetical protein n=1 Tax=Antarcticibacterium sp. 1MA-6-2 TaxID=2908210 RepID=UPI002882E03D|nr:hypothetical protein [Antarcticibacterium sp. 1MA-6-2]
MKLNLQSIPRVEGISKKSFLQDYFIPGRPVVFEDLTADWLSKRNVEFQLFQKKSGRHCSPTL